jgi:sugar O-acyltransferase (sialic acid O-acetyltransferase NeuD family)
VKKLYIAGASEPGHELLDIVRSGTVPYEFLGFYDELKTGQEIINSVSGLEKDAFFIIAIGNTSVRKRLFELFVASGLIPATIIAPSAYISTAAAISPGVVIYPNCSVSFNAEIGNNVIVNYNCSISHGVRIGPHCNITPGVNIAGNVTIGEKCFLGIGTAIIEKITLCNSVTIGANSTVIRDINIPGKYVGTPASLIKNSGFEPRQ